LRLPQQRAPIDILRRQIRLQLPDMVIEPRFQRHILHNLAEKHHRHMGVAINQPRKRHHPPPINPPRPLLLNPLPPRPHRPNPIPLHHNIPPLLTNPLPLHPPHHITTLNHQRRHHSPSPVRPTTTHVPARCRRSNNPSASIRVPRAGAPRVGASAAKAQS